MNIKPITLREFKEISEMVYERFGINLTEAKRNLVNGRLLNAIRQKGCKNFSEYIEYIKSDKTGEALSEMINRISTNHTYFMRERAHFDYFKNVALPEAIACRKRKNDLDLRIWSAGCSSGEEAYTLAILLQETLKSERGNWSAGILATDISGKVLEAASNGVYPSERLEKLPPVLKNSYFEKKHKDAWQARPELKREVTFRRFNLMNKAFPFKRKFQIIFCRNVMIYFDNPTKKELVRRFYENTERGGYLFIGHSETLGRQECPYEYIMPAVYRKS